MPSKLQLVCFLATSFPMILGSRWEAQLYEDLMYDYHKMPRPVQNSSDVLTVQFGSALIRIIDVDEKNQVFTTNVWLELHWVDAKLRWNPSQYNGIKQLHVSATKIWVPDIVLYNNAAGDPDITIYNEATVLFNGHIIWKPPAIYKSFCDIDVRYFPYDVQECEMKFGTWTYTGGYVDVQFLPWDPVRDVMDEGEMVEYLEPGMDLSYYQMSAEWDVLNITAARHERVYPGCCGPEKYIDITYTFQLRRKTLFFTCNLIIPCFSISFLTSFLFYLPDKKITFAISILVTLTFFFLILIEIIPPTSVVVPMFGQYLLYTMILLTISILVSVMSVNLYHRTGATHEMPGWMRTLFMEWLPKLLCMTPPTKDVREEQTLSEDERPVIPSFYATTFDKVDTTTGARDYTLKKTASLMEQSYPPAKSFVGRFGKKLPRTWSSDSARSCSTPKTVIRNAETFSLLARQETEEERALREHRGIILRLLTHVRFICEHYRHAEEQQQLSEEWRFVSTVLDRLCFVIIALLNAAALLIILRAPSLYDPRQPMANILPAASPLSHSRMHSDKLEQ